MKTVGLKIILWGIFFSFLATSLSLVSAADKTPPYTGWKPPEPFQPVKSAPPVKKALNKRAKAEKTVKASPDGKPVVAGEYRPQEYVVQEGDWIAKILREKGVLKENNLSKLLEMLRKFNQSMQDFDLIKPGEKIVILVKVESGPKAKTPPAPKRKVEPEKKAAPQTPPAPLKISRVTMDTQTVSTIQQLRSESYRIQQGDILSMVVMNRYDLSTRTFITEYLDLFKKSNPSIKNPDRIFPGQNVNLPLYPPQWYDVPGLPPAQPPIMRDLAGSNRVRLPDPTPVAEPEKTPTVATQLQPETTRKTWFSKKTAVAEKPKIPETPEVLPQSPPSPTKTSQKTPLPALTKPETTYSTASWQVQQINSSVSEGLGEILPQMGEQWVHSGEHFIPMKSGGHINLKADTYPIVKGPGGATLIVDLYNSLPPRMGRVIESSWGNYRIVHLSPTDDLQSAFGKILKAFQYPKVFKKGEPLKLTGTIPVSITGDWIVIPPRDNSGKTPGFIVINLLDDKYNSVPQSVKTYLNGLGVRFVEYPSPAPPKKPLIDKAPETAVDAPSLVEMVLTLTGHPHSTRVKIPAFESRNDDFKLTVTADFYLTAHGRERVIDLSGLDPEIVALLKERGVAVLSLSKEQNPLSLASKTLEFLGWQYKMGPHTLSTAPNSKQNVDLTLNGVIFSAEGGHSVFMTPLDLPPEVALFLYEKGYRVVTLATFSPGAKTHAAWGG